LATRSNSLRTAYKYAWKAGLIIDKDGVWRRGSDLSPLFDEKVGGASRYSYSGAPAPNRANPPVVSYGALTFDAGGPEPRHIPGYHSSLCAVPPTPPTTVPFDQDCGGGPDLDTNAERLRTGARSGFIDARVYSSTADASLSKIIPLNFDVRAFWRSLIDPTPGELGSMTGFRDANGDGHPDFNGIVYIEQAMSSAGTWPNVDQSASTPLAPAGSATVVERLPVQLSSATTGFYPNAVRIINASDLNTFGGFPPTNHDNPGPAVPGTTFPRGLTIVTNGPMYLLGDFGDDPVDPTKPNPKLTSLASDAFTMLSKDWDDAAHGFDVFPPPLTSARRGYLATAILTGNVPTTASVSGRGPHNAIRLLEDWDDEDLVFQGSLVVGFPSFFQRHVGSAAVMQV
jgi:hypothetical protein